MLSSEIPYIIGMSPHDALMISWSILWEYLHMHLVNWVEAVTLIGDAKVDVLVPPFGEGEMVVSGTYRDIYNILYNVLYNIYNIILHNYI